MIRPETKFYDVISTTSPGTFVNRVHNPTIGTGRNNRLGNKLQMLAIDFTCVNQASSGSWRVTVLIPKDPSFGFGSSLVYQRYDQDDYIILYDQVFSAASDNVKRIRVPLNMVQEYSSTSGLCVKNNVGIVLNSDVSANLQIGTRLYFHDY